MTPRVRMAVGELIAEAVAVFIIISFGCSVAGMYSLYDPSPYKNAYWGVCITWGLAVTIAIYVTGSITGTHANPAVTLALAIFRGFSWKKVVPYWIAQIFGGFCGAIIVYILYAPLIDHFNTVHGLTRAGGGSIGVFVTQPGEQVDTIKGFYDEIILTALLLFGIFAVTEEFNTMAPEANFGAIVIGLIVAVIGASAGYLEAWAINPARDLGPRIFLWLMGWGPSVFPGKGGYWWAPIAGPLIGGVVGGGAYMALIRPFLPRDHKAGPT